MAIAGKLMKLRSALKRLPSITRLGAPSRSVGLAASANEAGEDEKATSEQLLAVYVGRSRRRYALCSGVVGHPLFQELVDRSGRGGRREERGVVVCCEVVLFEHLLWMLEENGGAELESQSMKELVEFYTC